MLQTHPREKAIRMIGALQDQFASLEAEYRELCDAGEIEPLEMLERVQTIERASRLIALRPDPEEAS